MKIQSCILKSGREGVESTGDYFMYLNRPSGIARSKDSNDTLPIAFDFAVIKYLIRET